MIPSANRKVEEPPMAHEITAGSILIEENTVLPKELQFETEPCVPGWRVVKDFDGFGLGREILRIGWTFFCSAGEIRSTVFGIDSQKMVCRAIDRILAKAKSEKLNSLEIVQVTSVGSERFPLVHHVTVSARLRHIQQSLFLSRARDLPILETPKSESLSGNRGIESDKTPEQESIVA
jgi:hypothetical protein